MIIANAACFNWSLPALAKNKSDKSSVMRALGIKRIGAVN